MKSDEISNSSRACCQAPLRSTRSRLRVRRQEHCPVQRDSRCAARPVQHSSHIWSPRPRMDQTVPTGGASVQFLRRENDASTLLARRRARSVVVRNVCLALRDAHTHDWTLWSCRRPDFLSRRPRIPLVSRFCVSLSHRILRPSKRLPYHHKGTKETRRRIRLRCGRKTGIQLAN